MAVFNLHQKKDCAYSGISDYIGKNREIHLSSAQLIKRLINLCLIYLHIKR